MAAVPKVSPALQTLIEKGIFDRLPVTFSTYCYQQIMEWPVLFPAEKSYYERLLGLLDRSDAQVVHELFAPLREAERQMGVNDKSWPKRQFTLDQVDFLNRSPHYAEWREAVAGIFSRVDPLLDSEVARAGRARLVVVITPAELTVGPDRMWLRIRSRGKRIPVKAAAEEEWRRRLAQLVTAHAASKKQSPYSTWLVEAGEGISALAGSNSGRVALSYGSLETYRTRLMNEVRRLVEKEEIRGPRELSARLKQLKVLSSESDLARDPVLAEFLRAVLLNGNGTLLINNTFVQWATIQAIRRARPALTVVGFGIRNKIKPFSSLLIYNDPQTSNLIPNQMDTLGSYVDLEVLHQYLWQEFEKYAEYRRNTAYLFAGEGLEEILVIAPPDFPLLAAQPPVPISEILRHAHSWLGL